MGLIDVVIRSITCNGPDCPHTVTFDREQMKQTVETEGNEWLRSGRILQTSDGRSLFYCSDACEIGGIGTGVHTLPEPKKIISGVASQQAVAQAAASAKASEAATAAIKAGQPVTLG